MPMADDDLDDVINGPAAPTKPKPKQTATKKAVKKTAKKKATPADKYDFDLESGVAIAMMKALAKSVKAETVIKDFAVAHEVEPFKIRACAKELARKKILRVEKNKQGLLVMDVWKPKRAPKGASGERTTRPKQAVIVITIPNIPARIAAIIRTGLKLNLALQSVSADGVLVMA